MESWEVVGGREKTTKAAGQGLRPKPSVGLLGGPNREQGGRSGGEPPKNGVRRQNLLSFRPQRLEQKQAEWPHKNNWTVTDQMPEVEHCSENQVALPPWQANLGI